VGSGPPLHELVFVDLDLANGRALLTEHDSAATTEAGDRLFSVDLTTGNRSVVSDATRGAGPAIGWLLNVALDAARGRALLVDYPHRTLLAVDLVTGDRTVISGAGVGTGPSWVPRDLALDPRAGVAWVVEYNQAGVDRKALYAVDLESGDRVIASQ